MTIYSQSPGDIIAPGVTQSITEFVGGFVGACGEAAAAILQGAQNAVTPQASNVTDLAHRLIGLGLAAPNGTTSSQALVTGLAQEGIAASVIDNWRMALAQVTSRPVTLLLQNAQALPYDQGVLGHFISVVGYSPATDKFIVSDPNAPAAKQGNFVLYSASQLAAADPVNAIVPKFASGSGPGDGLNPIQQAGVNQVTAGNPFGIGGQQVAQGASNAAGNVLGGVGSVTSQTLADAGTLIGQNFEKAFGLSSAKDLGVRVLLIGLAFFLVLFGVLALVLRGAENEAAPAAQVAAASA